MQNPFETASRPYVEPDSIVLGAYSAWNRTLPFNPALYGVKHVLRLAGVARTVAGVSIGNDNWTFEATTLLTAAWAAGDYTWDLVLIRTSDSAESILESGTIKVFAATADRRDHAQIMVAKITSILENRADSDVGSYTIKTRSITKMTVKELIDWRDYYLAEIGRRPDAQGTKKNSVQVRFK